MIQQPGGSQLSPKRLKEKADILETNLFKAVSRQKDLSEMHLKISRKNFPDVVIQKALLQLAPRFGIPPREFLMGLRDVMQKQIRPGKTEHFEKPLQNSEDDNTQYDDTHAWLRTLEIIASPDLIEFIVRGVREIPSRNGEVAKSFFHSEKSPGQLLKNGVIDFKEINHYPIANSGDDLFYITYEKQGTPGLSFTGAVIPVDVAVPCAINIGKGVERIEDPGGEGPPAGYLLKARKTGVVLLERNQADEITAVDITDSVEIKKLDFSKGNVGSVYTCPVSMKVGVVCNGFKIRVHGKVEATIVDGGEVTSNNHVEIIKTQAGSNITALKEISIQSATHTTVNSERGPVIISRELIDSNISAPEVIFKEDRGLITHNTIFAEKIELQGLYYSGENIIHFGENLFQEKKALLKSREQLRAKTAGTPQ